MNGEKRVTALYLAVLFMFGTVTARLYTLSSGADDGAAVLSGQYSRRTELASRRGYILSRDLEPLGTEGVKYVTVVTPSLCRDDVNAAEALSEFTDTATSEIRAEIRRGKPFTVMTHCAVTSVFAKSFPFYGGKTSEAIHLLGYANEDGGICGMKKYFDDRLSATSDLSGRLSANYLADAGGGILPGSEVKVFDDGFSAVSGVVTTLSHPLQESVEKTADALIPSGAVVVVNSGGEILACTSRPTYKAEDIASLLGSEKGEFVNRALCGFAPGSMFKTAVAAAALERDIAYFDKVYDCEGYVEFGNMRHYCHRRTGHGELTMTEAFADSCNCYFIKLGLEIGLDSVFDAAEKLGIGRDRVLYGVGDCAGFLPRAAHYPPSMVANCVIGQGDVLVTPVEAARMMLCAATGKCVRLRAVLGFYDGRTASLDLSASDGGETVLSEATVEKMRLLLRACVKDGTGKRAAPSRLAAGGKTATAQTGRFAEDGTELNHIWFAGVYPIDDPEIAVAVLYDDAPGESPCAKEAFRAICEEYELLREAGKIR